MISLHYVAHKVPVTSFRDTWQVSGSSASSLATHHHFISLVLVYFLSAGDIWVFSTSQDGCPWFPSCLPPRNFWQPLPFAYLNCELSLMYLRPVSQVVGQPLAGGAIFLFEIITTGLQNIFKEYSLIDYTSASIWSNPRQASARGHFSYFCFFSLFCIVSLHLVFPCSNAKTYLNWGPLSSSYAPTTQWPTCHGINNPGKAGQCGMYLCEKSSPAPQFTCM